MATIHRRPEPQEQPEITWMHRLEPVVSFLAQAGVVLTLLSLGYIFFGVFKGYLTQPTDQTISNMRLVGTICMVAAVVTAVSLLLLYLEESQMALGMGLLGVVFYFGFPFAVGMLLKKAGAQSNQAIEIVNQKLVTAGQLIIAAVILWFVYAFIRSLSDNSAREQKKASVGFKQKAKDPSRLKAGKPTVLSRCWQLPYCRESVRKACPAFLAHRTCWKFRRGCYCDEEMIAKIVRGEAVAGPSKRGGAAYLQADIADRTGGPRKRTKPPCGKCFIYLEHQNLKHRAISPFILPATALVFFLLKDVFGIVYTTVGGWLTSLFSRFAFHTGTKELDPLSKQTEYLIAFIVGVFVLIYVTKFVECCIYKWKI